MASIRKRGSNSYLIVVSRGYDYEGNRLKSVQKTVKDPSFFGIRYAGAVVLHGQGDFFPTVCQAQFHGLSLIHI